MSDTLGLSPQGLALLSRLRVPQERQKLTETGLSDALLSQLVTEGILEDQNAAKVTTDYQQIYVDWRSQRGMLLDHTRTLAFIDALKALVEQGDRVVDVGTGSGILAMSAARAGASSAVGLELTDIAEQAAALARQNKLDTVEIVKGDATAYTADAPVDLIVSEWAGMFLIDEWRHYAAFCAVRDRNLRPGGKIVPYAGRMYLSAIDSRKLYLVRGYGFWESPVYGFDFSPIRDIELAQPKHYHLPADPNNIIDTQEIAAFDFMTGSEADFFFTTETVLRYPAAGKFHGLVGHFEMDMAPGMVLSTSPFAHETCWHQSYFPMPAIDVPAGGEIKVRFRSWRDDEEGVMKFGIACAAPDERLTPQSREHIFTIE